MEIVFQVPDLGEEESIDYICNKRSQTPEVAKEILRFFGGRVKHLELVTHELGKLGQEVGRYSRFVL